MTSDFAAAAQEPEPYARAQLAALSEKFSGFRLLSLSEKAIDGVPAAVVDYEWSSSGELLRQRQAYVPSKRCMFTLTLTARARAFPELERAWDLVVGSIRLQQDGRLRQI